MNIKRMPIKEFRELGLLQELNRQFLHPLGLALEVVIEDGEERLGGVWDWRGDDGGIIYDDTSTPEFLARAMNVVEMQVEARSRRAAKLGYVVQPLNMEAKAIEVDDEPVQDD